MYSMYNRFTSVLLGIVLLAGCSPKVTVNLIKAKAPLEPEEEVAIRETSESVPEGAVVLEAIKLTGKDYQELVGMAPVWPATRISW